MKQALHLIFIFYKRIFLTTLIVAIAVSITLGSIGGVCFLEYLGKAYVIITLFSLFFVYEIRHPNEYYFYYNLGFTKVKLWGISFLISLVIGILISLIVHLII